MNIIKLRREWNVYNNMIIYTHVYICCTYGNIRCLFLRHFDVPHVYVIYYNNNGIIIPGG